MDALLKPYEEKMTKTLSVLESDFNAIRAGRANPHVLDKITVDYYGAPTPLQQVGNVSVPEPRMILISVWDAKIAPDVSKAIQASDIGINPIVDGNSIRLNFPELTEERRKDLAKDVKKRGEDAKVAVRNIRRDGNDMLKKLKGSEYSEDSIKDMEADLQKLTDKYVSEVDAAIAEKSKEIMTV